MKSDFVLLITNELKLSFKMTVTWANSSDIQIKLLYDILIPDV